MIVIDHIPKDLKCVSLLYQFKDRTSIFSQIILNNVFLKGSMHVVMYCKFLQMKCRPPVDEYIHFCYYCHLV